jgi:hypothetical protein
LTVLALSRGALTAGAWPLAWQAGVKTHGTSSRCRRQIAWDDQPLCNLYSVTKGQQANPRIGPRHARPDRQSATSVRDLPGLLHPDCPKPTRGSRAGAGSESRTAAWCPGPSLASDCNRLSRRAPPSRGSQPRGCLLRDAQREEFALDPAPRFVRQLAAAEKVVDALPLGRDPQMFGLSRASFLCLVLDVREPVAVLGAKRPCDALRKMAFRSKLIEPLAFIGSRNWQNHPRLLNAASAPATKSWSSPPGRRGTSTPSKANWPGFAPPDGLVLLRR